MADAKAGQLEIRRRLRGQERLLWSGVPDPKAWFTSADIQWIPFGIIWTVPIGAEEINIARDGVSVAMFVLIPFLALGAYMLFGRFIYKYYRKKRTTYGITTERAIVMVGRSTAEVPLRQQPVTIRRSRNSRHASVILKDSRTANGWVNSGMELFVARSGLPIAFYDVAEPDAMLSALDKARSGLTRSR